MGKKEDIVRKHLKNWSILATIIGGALGSTSSIYANADIGEIIEEVGAPLKIAQMAGDAGTVAQIYAGKASLADVATLNPVSPLGAIAVAELRRQKLIEEENHTIASSSCIETPIEDAASKENPKLKLEEDNIDQVPTAITENVEPWKQTKAYKCSWWVLNGLLSPAHVVKYGLDRLYDARMALHHMLDSQENPNKLAKVGVLALDILSLPLTGARYVLDWALQGIQRCHDFLWNPSISWGTKIFRTVQLGLFVVAAKAAVSSMMAIVAALA